jgi:succinate dehydrogenase/fumarate reductase cytochrome b subunit
MKLFRLLGLMIAVFWCAAMVLVPVAAAAGAGQGTNQGNNQMQMGLGRVWDLKAILISRKTARTLPDPVRATRPKDSGT